MRVILLAAAVGTLGLGTPAAADTFDNESVVALAAAGVGDAVLLAKIGSLPCSYDVSTEQIIRLKKAGVTNAVITAMVTRCSGAARAQGAEASSSDPLVRRPAGLYIQAGEGEGATIRVIRPSNAGGARLTGNGSLLFPNTARLAIANPSAQTTAATNRPVFYFYFDASDRKTGDFGTSASAAAQSPSEFSLVRFETQGGQRQMTIGKATPFKTTIGLDPAHVLPFSTSEIGDSIFRVEPDAPLPPGQYGFVLRAGSDAYRIYDFQIR